MASAVIVQFLVGNLEVRIRRMISVRGKFTAEAGGTDVGGVLVSRASAVEGGVGNR